MHNTCSLS